MKKYVYILALLCFGITNIANGQQYEYDNSKIQSVTPIMWIYDAYSGTGQGVAYAGYVYYLKSNYSHYGHMGLVNNGICYRNAEFRWEVELLYGSGGGEIEVLCTPYSNNFTFPVIGTYRIKLQIKTFDGYYSLVGETIVECREAMGNQNKNGNGGNGNTGGVNTGIDVESPAPGW